MLPDPVLTKIRETVRQIVGPREFTENRQVISGRETVTFSLPTYPNWPGTVIVMKNGEGWELLEASEIFAKYKVTLAQIVRGAKS